MPRLLAVYVLEAVLTQRHSLQDAITEHTRNTPHKALVQELTYGVVRWQLRLELLLAQGLPHPLKRKDRALHYLLLLGLYQILYTRIPPHAAVSETVTACKRLTPHPWASRLINGVLRNFLRNQAAWLQNLAADPQATYSHPIWLLDTLQTDWPQHWADICHANNQKPPMTVRVNRQKTNRLEYQQRLAQCQMEATIAPYSADGLYLLKPCAVTDLPEFAQGWVAVQDEAAQLAADLLQLQPGLTVLDACSAPGGKTCHILEQQPTVQLLALDKDPQRLQQVADNLHRLGLQAQLQPIDALDFAQCPTPPIFDRILLDAPCSGTGVIRRHPDIKALRTPQDIIQLSHTQQALLMALWPLLAPGGILLYSTCSVLSAENDATIAALMAQQPDAELLPILAPWGQATRWGHQILPDSSHALDGFYYSRLRKRP